MGNSSKSNSRSSRSSRAPSAALSDHTPATNTHQPSRSDSQASGRSNHSNRHTEDHSAGLYGLVHNPLLSGSSSSSRGSNHRTQNQNPGHHQPPHPRQASSSSHRTNAQTQNPIVTHQVSNNDSQRSGSSQHSNRHRQMSNTTHENTNRSRTPALEEGQGRGRHSQPGSSTQHAQPGSSTQHAGPLFPNKVPKWVPKEFVNRDRQCTDCEPPVYLPTRRALINHFKFYPHWKVLQLCPHPNCLLVSTSSSGILLHSKNHEKPGKYKCNKCGAGYAKKQSLVKHMELAHYRVHDI